MANFSIGLVIGTAIGAGVLMAVHPMDKRAMRKAYHKAGKMMKRVNHSLRDWT